MDAAREFEIRPLLRFILWRRRRRLLERTPAVRKRHRRFRHAVAQFGREAFIAHPRQRVIERHQRRLFFPALLFTLLLRGAIWAITWTRLELVLRKGNLEIGDPDAGPEIEILRAWALRFAAAIIAILPLDGGNEQAAPDNQQGFPEGAVTNVAVNRYERDRRNRAAAIAIHGIYCKGCGMSFSERYGDIALGFIEIHHIVPVSKMPPGYVVDPVNDLVPLCSNCHSVVHREDPPLSVDALRQLIAMCHDKSNRV